MQSRRVINRTRFRQENPIVGLSLLSTTVRSVNFQRTAHIQIAHRREFIHHPTKQRVNPNQSKQSIIHQAPTTPPLPNSCFPYPKPSNKALAWVISNLCDSKPPYPFSPQQPIHPSVGRARTTCCSLSASIVRVSDRPNPPTSLSIISNLHDAQKSCSLALVL